MTESRRRLRVPLAFVQDRVLGGENERTNDATIGSNDSVSLNIEVGVFLSLFLNKTPGSEWASWYLYIYDEYRDVVIMTEAVQHHQR